MKLPSQESLRHCPLNPEPSLFSAPPVLRHGVCTVAARKVWCIMGKVIHWLRKYLNKQAVRWSIVVAIGADKSPTVCVAAAYQAATDALKKNKKNKKNCQLNLYFISLCFFCTSLPVFSSAWGATDATSRKICFKAKWQYLFYRAVASQFVCFFFSWVATTFEIKNNFCSNRSLRDACKGWSLTTIISVWWKLISL